MLKKVFATVLLISLCALISCHRKENSRKSQRALKQYEKRFKKSSKKFEHSSVKGNKDLVPDWAKPPSERADSSKRDSTKIDNTTKRDSL
jgi:hypothetical protein